MSDPSGATNPRDETTSRKKSPKKVLGPVLAGLMLDLLDFATYGPVGLSAGLVVGGIGGYFLAWSLGVDSSRRLFYAGLAGIYCMMPFTAFLPVATVLGTIIQLRESDPPEPPAGPDGSPPSLEAEYRSRWDE